MALSSQGEQIMLAVTPVVLGPLLPANADARARALQAAIATLDDYLAHMSLPLQRQVRFVFGALHLLPVRLLLLRTWDRWSDVAPERVETFLRSARDSRCSPLRRFYVLLQSMAVIAWFDLPGAWDDIGFPGPPIERPVRPGEPW